MLEADIIDEAPEAKSVGFQFNCSTKERWSICICCDFCNANKAIIREHYALPKVEDTLNSMYGFNLFAKIDVKSGFFQMTLVEES